MVDKQKLLDALPHYLAMLIIVFGTLFLIEAVYAELSFWIELAIIFVIVFAYRPIVVRLGVAPPHWMPDQR